MDYLQYGKDISAMKDAILNVLNLIINGLPSILAADNFNETTTLVLNLIINGLPSIFYSRKVLTFFF